MSTLTSSPVRGSQTPRRGPEHIAPDCRGENFWRIDSQGPALIRRNLPEALAQQLEPHFDRLGELAGGRLDELATTLDRHPPMLHPRDRFGRDEDWIEYHPAHREMEQIAFGEFGMHAMAHRPGVFGIDRPLPPSAKYAFQYLFAQAEMGFLCPISVTDTTAYVLDRYASPALKNWAMPKLLSQDVTTMWQGAQFMTEMSGGSDVGAIETIAERIGEDENGLDAWRLYGDKWFASHTTGDVALVLARPVGAPEGSRGLALFAMPHHQVDGTRNDFRMVRLKEKLGTRSLASAELKLEGALAYLVGNPEQGLKQVLDQVNQSRLSHAVRATGLMRRCLNEALAIARYRRAFGERIIEKPLMRRQLMKLMVPTEQALSMAMFTARVMDDDPKGLLLRMLTPLVKFRASRDNILVASGAVEARGGNGYIEDWVQARALRDAQLGTIWEGTSSIVALDAVTRAVAREDAAIQLGDALQLILDGVELPSSMHAELRELTDRAIGLIEAVARDPDREAECRTAVSVLYHVSSAVLLASEGSEFGSQGGDARRLLLARLVIDHRVQPTDPFAAPTARRDDEIANLLLSDEPVSLSDATARLT